MVSKLKLEAKQAESGPLDLLPFVGRFRSMVWNSGCLQALNMEINSHVPDVLNIRGTSLRMGSLAASATRLKNVLATSIGVWDIRSSRPFPVPILSLGGAMS